jgi:hypothetical protein
MCETMDIAYSQRKRQCRDRSHSRMSIQQLGHGIFLRRLLHCLIQFSDAAVQTVQQFQQLFPSPCRPARERQLFQQLPPRLRPQLPPLLDSLVQRQMLQPRSLPAASSLPACGDGSATAADRVAPGSVSTTAETDSPASAATAVRHPAGPSSACVLPGPDLAGIPRP